MGLPTVYAQIQIDEVSSTVTYIGFCMTNYTGTDRPLWAVFRIQSAAGSSPTGLTTIYGAQAPNTFDQVWDDRASLTYIPG